MKKSFLKISPAIFENISNEILDTNEIYQKKLSTVNRETAEAIENNFQVNQHFDKKSKTNFIKINIDDIEKFNQIMKNSDEEYLKLIEEHKRKSLSIVPHPNFYAKENHSLMKCLEFFWLYGIKPKTAASSFLAGSMLTYEILRRQAESDFLEEKFKQSY